MIGLVTGLCLLLGSAGLASSDSAEAASKDPPEEKWDVSIPLYDALTLEQLEPRRKPLPRGPNLEGLIGDDVTHSYIGE